MIRSEKRSLVAFLAILALMLLAILAPAVFSSKTLFTIDQAPTIFGADYQREMAEAFVGRWSTDALGSGSRGRAFHPTRLLSVLLPPLAYHLASYIADTLLLFFAGVYLLRGRGFRGMAVWLPSIALCFSGYAFSLINAGHRGMFHMMPYAVFCFGALDRGMSRGRLFHFALAGACAGFGIVGQPDVMLLFGLLAVCYGLYRLARTEMNSSRSSGALARRWQGYMLGTVLAGLFFTATSLGQFAHLLSSKLQQREGVRGKTAAEQWEFATNWSMPPEDMLEFIAPCVYGVDTQDRRTPYWGRLGQSIGWRETGQGFRNFRQHTIYLGALPLLFAFYGLLVGASRGRRSKSGMPHSAASGHSVHSSEREEDLPSIDGSGTRAGSVFDSADVIFWAVALVATVLLAMGRYFPLYHLFYSLPRMSMIRCPVKFIHLTEVAVCVLFAYGLQSFCSDFLSPVRIRVRRRLAWGMMGAWGAAALLLLAVLVTRLFRPAFLSYWRQLGLDSFSAFLMWNMTQALLRASALFAIGGAAFAVARYVKRPGKGWLVICLCVISIVLVIDVTTVLRRYIRTMDVSAFYAPSPVTTAIKESGMLGRASDRLSQRSKFDPRWTVMLNHDIDLLEPMQRDSRPSLEYQTFFDVLGQYPLRLWTMTGTHFIVGPAAQYAPLAGRDDFSIILGFDVQAGRMIVRPERLAENVLLRFHNALPKALVLHDVRRLVSEMSLTEPDWDPHRTVWVSEDVLSRQSSRSASPVEVVRYTRPSVRLKVDLEEDGVLLLNDKYDPDWRVKVDGEPAPLLRCNYIMRGVYLPAGTHSVQFIYRPAIHIVVLSLGSCLVLLVWGLWHGKRTRACPGGASRGRN